MRASKSFAPHISKSDLSVEIEQVRGCAPCNYIEYLLPEDLDFIPSVGQV